MKGELLIYHPTKKLVAFKSGTIDSTKAIVLIGGLTDGLLTLSYANELNRACTENGYALIHVLLSSSYQGFGTGSLDTDAEELNVLIDYLSKLGINRIHLLGHSTGCQDIIWLFRKYPDVNHIRSVILQGPLSDADFIQYAHSDLVEQYNTSYASLPKNSILPFTIFNAPITSYRFSSLAFYDGDDNLPFKNAAEKKKRIKELPVPCLVVMSGKDQYVPPHLSPKTLLDDFEAEYTLLVANADHSLSGQEMEFLSALFQFLNTLK